MNILAANDDGFESEGIKALARALEERSHNVITVAPFSNRSGNSHSMTIQGALEVKRISSKIWACKGTPVDCVSVVCAGGVPFNCELVVSGINAGANLGTDILFSGTAGAARQGALKGLPSIAFSLTDEGGEYGEYHWEAAARWAANHLEKLIKLWNKDVFINVNMPNLPEQKDGFCLTHPERRIYHEKMEPCKAGGKTAGGNWEALTYKEFYVENKDEDGSDYSTVRRGLVSVSVVEVFPRSAGSAHPPGEKK